MEVSIFGHDPPPLVEIFLIFFSQYLTIFGAFETFLIFSPQLSKRIKSLLLLDIM